MSRAATSREAIKDQSQKDAARDRMLAATSPEDRARNSKEAAAASRRTARVGSRAEHVLLARLEAAGLKPIHRGEHGDIQVKWAAIFVEGPPATAPLWSPEKTMEIAASGRAKRRDALAFGLHVYRVLLPARVTATMMDNVCDQLIPALRDCCRFLPEEHEVRLGQEKDRSGS